MQPGEKRPPQEGRDVIAEINALGGTAIFVKNAGIEQALVPLPEQTPTTRQRRIADK